MACLNSCCCCFSTFQGSIILAVIIMVPHMVAVGFLSYFINMWEVIQPRVSFWAQTANEALSSSTVKIGFVTDFLNSAAADMYTVVVAVLVYTCVIVLICVLLITGVYQASRCLMLPWLTLILLKLLASISAVIIYFYVVANMPDGDPRIVAINVGIAEVAEIVILSYFWLVVFSYYQHLQQMEEQIYPCGEEEPVEVMPPIEDTERRLSHVGNYERYPHENRGSYPNENHEKHYDENHEKHHDEMIEKY